MHEITFERASELLEYRAGKLYWKSLTRWRPAGRSIGTRRKNGRVFLIVDGRTYAVHRLVWLLCKGAWPTSDLDHVNRDPADNRIENLRECTKSQNQANRAPIGATGLKGVTFHRASGKFQAKVAGRYLGLFSTAHEAARHADIAAASAYGEFAFQNFPSERTR